MYSKQKRFIALFLAVFTLSMNVTVAEVQAESIKNELVTDILVVAGAVIGSETALAYALGALGFTAASALIYENRDSLVDWCDDVKADFIDFCAKSKEWASVTGAKIQNWLEGIATGVLDKADETWLALKDFCVDIYNKQKTNDISGESELVTIDNFEEFLDSHSREFLNIYEKSVFLTRKEYTAFQTKTPVIEKHSFDTFCGLQGGDERYSDFTRTYAYNNPETFLFEFSDSVCCAFVITPNYEDSFYRSYDKYSYLTYDWISHDTDSDGNIYEYSRYFYDFGPKFMTNHDIDFPFDFCGFWLLDFNSIEKPFAMNGFSEYFQTFKIKNSYKDLVNKYKNEFSNNNAFNLIYAGLVALSSGISLGFDDWEISIPQDDGIGEEKTQEYVVDGSIEGVIERDGTLDNVDVINPPNVYEEDKDKVFVDVEGIGIEDIAKPFPDERTITIDNTGDVVLPDKKPVPKPVDNSDVKDYTLTGIQKVFPFCIPWDFYLLVKTLSAEPKAPKFEWTITYFDRKKKKEEKLEIDFSVFDSVAKVLRTMELLAFIIFLTLKTRDLIKG